MAIKLVYLLLNIVSGCITAQQDPFCTESYAEFESASVGSNDSGRDIRNQLYKAFYAPNQQLPYSVLVTYQLVLTNGTRVNLSSHPDCSRELWMWLSSPALLMGDITYLNHLLLFALNYFAEWHPPHLTVTTATAPCPDKIKDFLSEMTASVSVYVYRIRALAGYAGNVILHYIINNIIILYIGQQLICILPHICRNNILKYAYNIIIIATSLRYLPLAFSGLICCGI